MCRCSSRGSFGGFGSKGPCAARDLPPDLGDEGFEAVTSDGPARGIGLGQRRTVSW
jgi:hypothetical protein